MADIKTYEQVLTEAMHAGLDAACRVIQDHLGVTTGDFAGLHWSGAQADAFRDMLKQYMLEERADQIRNQADQAISKAKRAKQAG